MSDLTSEITIIRDLLAEAKGMAKDGSVTDHLDAAENCLDRIEAVLEGLIAYGEAQNDGTNSGTLFRFKDGGWFFLALSPSKPKINQTKEG